MKKIRANLTIKESQKNKSIFGLIISGVFYNWNYL